MATVADGSFALWRGHPVDIGGTWAARDSAHDQIYSSGWAIGPGSPYASTPRMDYAAGGPLAGENWAEAAAGDFDARWSQQLREMKASWGSRLASNMYIRFAHEMNGNWFPWSVAPADVGNYITAWRRFYSLIQINFPGAKLVWCANAESSWNYDIRTLWPGDAYVNVVGVDAYNEYPWVNDQAAFNTRIYSLSSQGGPVGIEQWRHFALVHGKPLSIPEWANAAIANGGGGGDAPVYMSLFHDWLLKHGGTGPGNVLYEVFFNVAGFPEKYQIFASGKGSAYEPQAAAAYRSAW